MIAPPGEQFGTDPDPSGLAISASGKVLIAASAGPPIASLTELQRGETWAVYQLPLGRAERVPGKPKHPAPAGVAFSGEHAAFVSEGSTGHVALMDVTTGDRRSAFDLNRNGAHDSFTGDLALDAARRVLYVADTANSRVVAIDVHLGVIDARPRGILGTVALDSAPYELTLSPDRQKLYATEAESGSVAVIDVSDTASAKVEAVLRAASPSGLVAAAGRVYVSNAADDSITVIDAGTNRVEREIPLRIPGFEQLRGIEPAGLAYDEKTGWLLVAESGINAVAVIDTHSLAVLGHIPAGWCPTHVLIDRGTVYVANRRGQGAGSSVVSGSGYIKLVGDEGSEGSISLYPLPSAAELAADTEFVMRAAGFVPSLRNVLPMPPEIRYAVLIVNGSRAFDEVLGDERRAANGPVAGAPVLARYGQEGSVNGLRERLSLHDVNITPNYHAIAERWAFSDNFYAVSDATPWTESWKSLWDHLQQSGIAPAFFEAFDITGKLPQTELARRLIREFQSRYVESGADLPRFVQIYLPNGRAAKPRPADGYPYEESYLLDNDNAVGQILEFFSSTKWWGQMAVFLTSDSARGGADHIDAYRTLLLAAGPWNKRNYVSHTNTGFAGLVKTIFEILHVPPMNLFDASAADLSDCFQRQADAARYAAAAVDTRVYDPGGK